MRPPQIIPVEELRQAALLFDAVGRRAPVDPFVLHGPPQALDEDVVVAAPASCASAAKLRAAGPFSPSASVPRPQPVPATSDRRPAVPALDASSGRRVGKEMISRRLFSLPDAE